MEKIYMENFNNKKSKKVIKGRRIFITSILMMVMAIALFVTAGFNEVSYAVDSTGNTGFGKLAKATSIKSPEPAVTYHINGYHDVNGSNDMTYVVPVYNVILNNDTANPVQVPCLDRNNDLEPNKDYTADSSNSSAGYSTPGLALLLFAFDDSFDDFVDSVIITRNDGAEVTQKDKNMVKTFLVQTAIWVYQDRLDATSPYSVKLTGDRRTELLDGEGKVKQIDAIQYHPTDGTAMTDPTQTVTLQVVVKDGSKQMRIADAIEDLVEKAKGYDLDNAFSSSSIGLSVSGEQKVTDEYFISGPLTANYSDNLTDYSVKIVSGSDTPEGAKIVDADGNEISESDVLIPSRGKLYIQVPKKSVSKDKNKVTVKITGNFYKLGVNRFVATGSQSIGEFTYDETSKDSSIEVKFKEEVDVPNTGMTTAQTIYFVGLVVLLCGVGIVYANVKPKEAE